MEWADSSTQLFGKLIEFVVAPVVAHALDHLAGGRQVFAGLIRVALRQPQPRRF